MICCAQEFEWKHWRGNFSRRRQNSFMRVRELNTQATLNKNTWISGLIDNNSWYNAAPQLVQCCTKAGTVLHHSWYSAAPQLVQWCTTTGAELHNRRYSAAQQLVQCCTAAGTVLHNCWYVTAPQLVPCCTTAATMLQERWCSSHKAGQLLQLQERT